MSRVRIRFGFTLASANCQPTSEDTKHQLKNVSGWLTNKQTSIQPRDVQHKYRSNKRLRPSFLFVFKSRFFALDEILSFYRFFFGDIAQCEVRRLCLSGPHAFPTPLLLECLDSLLPCITAVFNNSLVSGVFPSVYKSALVKPLLKKMSLDPDDLNNCRPVSNLSFLSKVLEMWASALCTFLQ